MFSSSFVLCLHCRFLFVCTWVQCKNLTICTFIPHSCRATSYQEPDPCGSSLGAQPATRLGLHCPRGDRQSQWLRAVAVCGKQRNFCNGVTPNLIIFITLSASAHWLSLLQQATHQFDELRESHLSQDHDRGSFQFAQKSSGAYLRPYQRHGWGGNRLTYLPFIWDPPTKSLLLAVLTRHRHIIVLEPWLCLWHLFQSRPTNREVS